MSTPKPPLKPTASNVNRVLKTARVSPTGMAGAGLHAGGRVTGEIVVDYHRPLGAAHATDADIDAWFETATTALAERGLVLTRHSSRVALVTAAPEV